MRTKILAAVSIALAAIGIAGASISTHAQDRSEPAPWPLDETLGPLRDGLLHGQELPRPQTVIDDQTITITFHDSKGNPYHWYYPVEAYEQLTPEGSELWPDSAPVRLAMPDDSVILAPSLDGFARGSFSEVIDDVYRSSDSESDFIWEVWYIVSQLTVYQDDIDETSEGRFAIETLVRGGGDCEDLVILAADMLISSRHTDDWLIQYVFVDSDNPARPSGANHVVLFVDTAPGDDGGEHIIEATGPPSWSYYPDGINGWSFDV